MADAALPTPLEHGFDHVDTAASDGDAELRLGEPGVLPDSAGDLDLLRQILDAAVRLAERPDARRCRRCSPICA